MIRPGHESEYSHTEEVFSDPPKMHGNTKIWWEEKGISLPPNTHDLAITPHQVALLQYIVNRGGLDTKMIAEEIDRGEQTIKNTLSKTYARIGVNDCLSAVLWGLRSGVLTLDTPEEQIPLQSPTSSPEL